ncbi:light-harvesting protein [Halorhodospira halochloris]|uniref:Light-harvesting LHI n=1 Tax=Halorhodospira halochloris TaxID=1052 RepID=A0A120MZP7_HALHR|nr:light-harvesting antenna LH1, alpha subunit [Halorhodospira halochloris]MBK1651231.1 light-harvesting protein [Halorhodospira halochloris]MCG5530745.1 light-harvesting protein [Halorhodospira halochloris]MCG5548564.1 light-harvesting protein [Halorhodospira halochloris]BAU57506.1 light-harvesting LHI [Halorhodospira halochloris]
MWRIWKVFDPRRILIATALWLIIISLTIHVILMTTERFNWLQGAPAAEYYSEVVEDGAALSPRLV